MLLPWHPHAAHSCWVMDGAWCGAWRSRRSTSRAVAPSPRWPCAPTGCRRRARSAARRAAVIRTRWTRSLTRHGTRHRASLCCLSRRTGCAGNIVSLHALRPVPLGPGTSYGTQTHTTTTASSHSKPSPSTTPLTFTSAASSTPFCICSTRVLSRASFTPRFVIHIAIDIACAPTHCAMDSDRAW